MAASPNSHRPALLSSITRPLEGTWRGTMAGVVGEVEVKASEGEAKVAEWGEKVVEEVSKQLEEAKVGEAEVKDEAATAAEVVVKEEDVKMDGEPKTGVSFPVKLADGKQLKAMGVRKKKILGLGINIYAFGMYADNAQLKELLKAKLDKAQLKPTKELYEAVINSDVGMAVRLVIVFGGLTMSAVRKSFDEGLGGSIKKLTGGQKNEELVNKVMGAAKDSIKLPHGSVIEITRSPGYVLQTKVKGEVVSNVESELLCRAYFHMYLGDDPFDKEAKERFGASLVSPF